MPRGAIPKNEIKLMNIYIYMYMSAGRARGKRIGKAYYHIPVSHSINVHPYGARLGVTFLYPSYPILLPPLINDSYILSIFL